MNAVILCAGFATRMYPLTQSLPKPLLHVAGRPVLDYLMDQLSGLPGLEAIYIVCNNRFFEHFSKWRADRMTTAPGRQIPICLLNDGTVSNDRRLGAVGDLHLALTAVTDPDRVLVSAGDNIYLFQLRSVWERFQKTEHHLVVALPETDEAKLKRTGVLGLDNNDRVIRLHEKPDPPPSNWVCPPLYFFQPSVHPRVDAFLKDYENVDAPGRFIDYLCQQEPVTACRLSSSRLDIGNMGTYRQADRLLRRHPELLP